MYSNSVYSACILAIVDGLSRDSIYIREQLCMVLGIFGVAYFSEVRECPVLILRCPHFRSAWWRKVLKGIIGTWLSVIIMPWCACASEVYGSVFVCLCVCVCRLLQLLKDELSASKSFYRLLVMFTWILICGFAK